MTTIYMYRCPGCGFSSESEYPPFPHGGLSYNYASRDDDPMLESAATCARCGGPLRFGGVRHAADDGDNPAS